MDRINSDIVPRERNEGFAPLSFGQERLWFLHQLDPESTSYNESGAFRFYGPLDAKDLEAALNEVIRRHEVLRTTYVTTQGKPAQCINPPLPVSLPVIDLSGISKNNRYSEALRIFKAETKRPFDLSKGPLLRFKLLRLNNKEHWFIISFHHIACDGWSTGLFLREVIMIYRAFSNNQPSPLSELPTQYADYAIWQRERMQGEIVESLLTYWKRKLAKPLALLDLPTDLPRPAVYSFRRANYGFELPQSLWVALRDLKQHEKVTLFMTLLAAFKVLLYHYTGQEDIIVESPIADRKNSKIRRLIGFFVNTLILRTDLSGNPTFRELLNRVSSVCREAYDNQELPFDKLVLELKLERNPSRPPLGQVAFMLHKEFVGTTNFTEKTILNTIKIDNGADEIDLAVFMWEGESGLTGNLIYNANLFRENSMARITGHFRSLLESIVADPDQRISDLPILTENERHQLLFEWNDTKSEYPQDQCIHELFEEQAEKTPEAVAVGFEDKQLTYKELNTRANQLAHYLKAHGVGPEVIVGICMERSLEMIVGLLAILKSGGAYLPLDPTYPKERLTFMLEDCNAPVLLTQERVSEKLPEHRAHVICLDKEWTKIAKKGKKKPVNAVTPENLAYIIYTSGSTGKPKGTLIGHEGLCNLAMAQIQEFEVGAGSRVLQFASLSYDASVWEIVMALISGATLCLTSQQRLMSGLELIELLNDNSITTVTLPPSVLSALPRANLSKLHTIISAGERCSIDLVSHWSKGRRFFNAYGPTETTVCATLTECIRSNQQDPHVGRPIANTQIFILDHNLNPVPVGVPGEMHIGGVGLARGYINHPALTAEKFTPNPFSEKPGDRLYKSGDLARYLPDGNIDFLGRMDQQVKVRGFRIETGEIESVLREHTNVSDAIVITREDERGASRLVAYVTTQGDHESTIGELRAFLKEKLPEHMVPSSFVMMDELPLTASGKIDLAALPRSDGVRPELDRGFVAPRTPTEQVLADLWAKFLGVDKVGVYDNFFELGGDSIMAIQIISKANQHGLRFTPKQIFLNQTVAELSKVADTSRLIKPDQGLVTGKVPLTPIQFWFFEQNLPDPNHFNQSILLEISRRLDPLILESALHELVKHHDALRLRFLQSDGGRQQVITGLVDSVPFSRIDISELSAREQSSRIQAAAEELHTSLNLSQGPLFRVAYFDPGPNKPGRLLFIIHHLAIDGVSWRMFLEDLLTAYQQLSQNQQITLPPKTTSFKQWAEKLSEYAHSEVLQEEIGYWLSESGSDVLPLPVDNPGGNNAASSSRTVSVSLSAEETQALLHEVPSAYRSQISDVLLTALLLAFAEWTGRNSLLVDIEGHGREELFDYVDISRTVGWFTSLFPVLLKLEGSDNPGNALKSVKEQLRRIPNRGIGYGLLRYVNGNSEISDKLIALPQADVSFNYLGQFDRALPNSSHFALTRESSGPNVSPLGTRRYLVEINGGVAGGQLQMAWIYSENLHQHTTIEGLAQKFSDTLKLLVERCASHDVGGYTPSDFPAARLDRKQLNKFIAKIRKSDRSLSK